MNTLMVDDAAISEQRRLWTYKEFERAGELGLFAPGERLELIEGEIIRKVAPQLTPHAVAVGLVQYALTAICPANCHVRVQLPMQLGEKSGPEPDFAVVSGCLRDYLRKHPSTASLVVEVADSSLRLDRGLKASLYARAGVPEYWIIDLKKSAIEVHRDPERMEDRSLGYGYRSITRYVSGDEIAPLMAVKVSVNVSDLLP